MCPQRGRSLSLSRFFHGCGTVGVTLHVEKERDFLEGAVYLSTKKFLRERSVEAIPVAAQMRA